VTLAEAAMLGGLVQAPTRLAPNRNPEAAKARAELVLAAMVREGFVSQAKAAEAEAAPAVALSTQRGTSGNYPADYVMDRIDELIGTVDTDLVVTTTLDPALQGFAEQALVAELDAKGAKYGVSQGAFVAMAPDGSIRALVGGRNYTESQYNRAVTAKRQPGSAFKPFVYLTALEKGLTPDTIREDGPLNVKGWKPENYSREYFGPVTLTNALALSLNTVAVRVGMEVGPRNVAATARRLGIYSKLDVNASLALGTSEVTPLEMVSAYGAFANGGYLVEPRIIREIRTRNGEVIFTRADPEPVQVIAPPILAMLNTMLRETLVSGTGKKAELPGWEAAGKTGTSQDFRDAWFIGYTGTLVAGVWLGNDDGSPTKRVTGGNLPVEIWSKFMKSALGPVKPVPLPASDDPVTNLLSGWKFPWDPATDSAPRPPGSIPQP
jgi:penicillin-binding protein 1A